MEKIWADVRAAIKKHIPAHIYKMWIDSVEYNDSDNDSVTLSCPNYFSQKRIKDNYKHLIKSEFEKISGKPLKLKFIVSAKKFDAKAEPLHLHPDVPMQMNLPFVDNKMLYGRMLRQDYTFKKFVVGKNSDFAYSAALSLASSNKSLQNSLFLLSNTGMGKSHLAQAVGHQILSDKPKERVYYITAEDFTNEMVSSIKSSSIDKFKSKYRTQCDVLLLEDVHFLTGKEKTQVELAMTLDYLFESDKKIIFSSCHAPNEIPKLNEQLKSRLSSSLISRIGPPRYRTRMRILQRKAESRNYNISTEVLEYLASELTENVRQLESGLAGVAAKASILGLPIDLKLAESVLADIVRTSNTISIDAIKKIVSENYKITIKDLVSSSRKQAIVRPRQIAMYLARKYTDQPLNFIGKSFNRYHATAIHAINTVERGIRLKSEIGKQAEILSRKLDSGNF